MRSRSLLWGILITLAILLLVASCLAQSPATNPEWSGNQLTIAGYPTQQVSTAIAWRSVGNPGLRTLYYWIVTHGVSDTSSPAGPFPALNAPDVLTSSKRVTLSWQPISGAVSYDVLRTSTKEPPAGTCNCAIATGVTTSSVDDVSETMQAYTVPSPLLQKFTVTNEQLSDGVYILRVRWQGVPVFDIRSDGTTSSIGGGASWRIAAGVPSSSAGSDGDYDLNTDTGDVYKKQSGAWSLLGNVASNKASLSGATFNGDVTVPTLTATNGITAGAGYIPVSQIASYAPIVKGNLFTVQDGPSCTTSGGAQPGLCLCNTDNGSGACTAWTFIGASSAALPANALGFLFNDGNGNYSWSSSAGDTWPLSASTPSFNPVAGAVSSGATVTASCTTGTLSISCDGTTKAAGATCTANSAFTMRARCEGTGYKPVNASAAYTIAASGVSFIQAGSVNDGGSTSRTITLSGVVAGHQLAVLGMLHSPGIVTVSDDKGSTYSTVLTAGSGPVAIEAHTLSVGGSGSTTVTINSTASAYGEVFVAEISGATALDVYNANSVSSGSTALAWPSITTTGSADLVLAMAGSQTQATTYTAGSGFTIPTNGQTSGMGQSGMLEYGTKTGAGAIAPAATSAIATDTVGYVVAFK